MIDETGTACTEPLRREVGYGCGAAERGGDRKAAGKRAAELRYFAYTPSLLLANLPLQASDPEISQGYALVRVGLPELSAPERSLKIGPLLGPAPFCQSETAQERRHDQHEPEQALVC
jgi:hypothetical protein